MKRWALALVLLVAGCSSDDDATVTAEGDGTTSTSTTTTVVPAGDIRLLVAAGDEVLRWVGGTTEVVASLDGDVAVAYGDGRGAVVAEVDGALVDLRDGTPVAVDLGAPGRALLFDLVTVDGTPSVLYGLRDDSEGEARGDVVLQALATGVRRPLATGYAPEHHTFAGSVAGGLLAVSAHTDLTESVTMYPIDDGTPDPVWSPTIDLPYNAAPLVLDAILAPDGGTIAWLSGPEGGVGAWEVVVADLGGVERRTFPLALAGGESGVRLDFDGERVLVSTATDQVPGAPLLVAVATGDVSRLAGIAGVATFD